MMSLLETIYKRKIDFEFDTITIEQNTSMARKKASEEFSIV